MMWLEYRDDFASSPIFDEGSSKGVRSQQRLTLGIVHAFDSHLIEPQ
jgi:hypothetical protein